MFMVRIYRQYVPLWEGRAVDVASGVGMVQTRGTVLFPFKRQISIILS